MNKITKIMICDDSITIRKRLRDAIMIADRCEFIEARNGQEAVNLYKNEKPCVIFMDIIMPELDGVQALEQIMSYDEKAKIIMLSSVGTKQNLKRALELGAKDFIQKPWDVGNLNTILAKYIKE